jgi:hypothetical protein
VYKNLHVTGGSYNFSEEDGTSWKDTGSIPDEVIGFFN